MNGKRLRYTCYTLYVICYTPYHIRYRLFSVLCLLISTSPFVRVRVSLLSMLHAPCPMPFLFRIPKPGTRPQSGGPEDKSKTESGCILYYEWLYSLVRLHTLARQAVSILLE